MLLDLFSLISMCVFMQVNAIIFMEVPTEARRGSRSPEAGVIGLL